MFTSVALYAQDQVDSISVKDTLLEDKLAIHYETIPYLDIEDCDTEKTIFSKTDCSNQYINVLCFNIPTFQR